MNPGDYRLVDVERPEKLTRGDVVLWPPDRSATCVLDVDVSLDGAVRVRTVAGELTVPPSELRDLRFEPLVLVVPHSPTAEKSTYRQVDLST